MQIKKITFIFVLLLLGASGLLTGCKTVYDRMKLELSVEEIELFLPLEEEAQSPDEVENPVDETEGEEEDTLSEAEEMFTATVSNVPKKIIKKVTYQTTNDGIVSVAMSDEVDGETEITVTALRPGRTELIIKTLEGNKSKSVAILVLKRIENMTRNENYSLAVPVGVPTNINTAAAINFYPFNTNQKDVKYTLEAEVEGVTVSEAGLITVSEKAVEQITVIATSLDDESLSVSIPVVIIEPIETSDVILTTEKAIQEWVDLGNDPSNISVDVAELLLANNMTQTNTSRFIARINSSELFRLVVTSSNNDIVEVVQIEKLEETFIYLKANNLGQATITVRAEIEGYEQYYAQKTIAVKVVNLATSVTIDGASTPRTNYAVYNNYFGLYGREVKIDLGPISAFSKAIALKINEEDIDKITIRYSDGTVLSNELINTTILPRGMSLYISAKQISENSDPVLKDQENTVELTFVANSLVGAEVEVSNTVSFKLTQGATSLEVPASVNLKKGLSANEYPNIAFTILPTSAINDELKVESLNTSIVTTVKAGANSIYKFIAHEAGTTQVKVTTSNGITKLVQVEVYVELEGAALMIEAPEQNYQVAERIQSEVLGAYGTVVRATVAVGAGIQMNVIKYPSDASVISTTFMSTNPSVATINNNGYFLVKSIGQATLRATIVSREFLNNSESVFVTKTYELQLTSYVPIRELNLNQIQITLYDENSLGYFDLESSQFELIPTISPDNATFNKNNLNWHSNSPYLSINNGILKASVPRDVILANNEIVATVTVSATEYNRYFAKTAVVTIRRAVQVQSITVYNVVDGYVYFDAREGVVSAPTKQLSVQTYPYNATNSNIRYVYVKDAQDPVETPVFSVVNGVITPLRAGIAKLHVVAEDSFISETEYARYVELVVKVADGLTENTALEIKTANDLTQIDTIQELALHYVLANNIDLTGVVFTPIGLIGNTMYPFSGSFSGKFTYGQISKQYKIKGLSFNTTLTGADYYSAMFLHNQGTIKNLELEIANLAVFSNNNSNGSYAYIAGLVALNDGTLENIVVNVKQSMVRVSAQTAYVSMLAAVNNNNITNSVSYGSLVVKEENPAVNQKVYVGGLAGINNINAIILGSHIPANRLINEQTVETDYSNVLYQKEGMSSFANINTAQITSMNSASALAVGLNYGQINRVATDGSIVGNDNIGGLVGINANLVENSYSSSKVEGRTNVGGLAGYATQVNLPSGLTTAKFINNAVEIYDRKDNNTMADIMIMGKNNVGGLIGYVNALQNFEYNYVNSYVLRSLGATYEGDIALKYHDELTVFVAGGLIGKLENVTINFNKNYANVNLNTVEPQTNYNNPVVYAGGFVGFVEGSITIEHAYTRGSITLPNTNSSAGNVVGYASNNVTGGINYVYSTMTLSAETTNGFVGASGSGVNVSITNTDHTLWDTVNAPLNSIWYVNAQMNDGLPLLKSPQQNLLINEAPQAIVVSVKDSQITLNLGDGSISFNHIKVAEKQALVLLSEQEYSIKNIINTYPMSGRYYLSTENTDLIEILENGNIRTLKEGVATIRVSSLLNTNVFDTFELAVVAGFTNFNLSKSQDMTSGNVSINDILQIKKNSSILLYSALTRAGYVVGTNTGVIYTASAGGFTVNNKALNATIENVSTHILNAGNTVSDGNILVTATPYVLVSFNGQLTYVEISELAKTFYVAIYEGATNINTSLASATIGLKEELTLEVYVTTDKQFEDITVEMTESITPYIEVMSSGAELIDGTTEQYVYTYIIKATPEFLAVNGQGSGNFKSAKSGVITFKSSSNAQVSSAFNISITPQDLLRIDMAHYPTGETKIDNYGLPTYYPKELPSNIIAPAQPGILKVNLYPEYANIDYYEIVSSTTNSNQFISFEQMALVSQISSGTISSIYYAPVVPSPAGVMFGTKLNLISTENHQNGGVQYSFDGNIYIKTLISSSVKKGTVFTVTLTGYRVDENNVAHVNLSKQIQLTVDALPGITLLYDGARTGYVAKGTTVPLQLLVTDNYNGTIQKPTASLEENITENTIVISEDDKQLVAAVSVIENAGNYYLEIGPGVPSGSTIKVLAEIHRTINGMLEKSQSEITLKVVDFVVKGVQIKESQNGTMNLYVGQTQNLRVELETTKWDGVISSPSISLENRAKLEQIKDEMLNKLRTVENSISRNMKYWFERTGSQGAYSDTTLEENNYLNYSIYKLALSGEVYDYAGQADIFVGAKKISTNTTLATKVEFYYDLNGAVQPVMKENNVYVNYPQIYSETGSVNLPNDVQIRIVENTTKLNIVANTTEDRPVPIYNEQDLLNMQPGVDYILLNDKNNPIVLENWKPLTTAIKSLDGNERIIKIKSFAPNATSGSYNFGLFGEVNQNTVLKNIKVDIAPLLEEGGLVSATEFTNVNFGFIAGVNSGTISNSDVINSYNGEAKLTLSTTGTASTSFGAFVGVNMGYITNSRVGIVEKQPDIYYPIVVEAKGNVAGFTSTNSGVIASSYAANITIKNTSSSLQTSKTAGFVALNANNARISSSFVEGIQSSIASNKVIQLGGLNSIGTIGGFVHENAGIITDAYANLPIITESRSAGFVYQNKNTGVITNAYSASKIIENTTANLPFVGSSSLEELLNENPVGLSNTYYLQNNNYFTSQFAGGYPAIAVSSFDKKTSFTGFGFLSDNEYEEYGTWTISAEQPRPVLQATLDLITSERKLTTYTTVGGTITDYYYADVESIDNKKGSKNNPILVANAKQFLEAMTLSHYLSQTDVNSNHIRLIRDIDFSEIVNNSDLLKLQRVVFTGVIDGNGMSFNNVRVLSPSMGTQSSFGMFYQIGLTDSAYIAEKAQNTDRNRTTKAIIKNLNINVIEISATESVSVGVLAGSISNSIILNVNVSGTNITVQGRNLVGSLAGKITGDSRLINVTTNLSVSSEYRTTDDEITGKQYRYYNEYGTSETETSYAGGIVGVLDLYSFDEDGNRAPIGEWAFENPKASLLTVRGSIIIRGEKTGGVIGYVGKDTYVKNILFELNHRLDAGTQSLVGLQMLGGVVGENSGLIDHARIEHIVDYQINTIDKTPARALIGYQNLFKETSEFVGGLVGYNNMGTILNSYSRADIINQDDLQVAGGLVGVMYGGELNKVYATGHIVSKQTIGGLVGQLLNSSLQQADENGVSIGEIATFNDAFSLNNWQVNAYANAGKALNIGYDLGESFVDVNGDGVYNVGEPFINLTYGAFIGKMEADAMVSAVNSWFINQVFSVTSAATPQQTRVLKTIGNSENAIAGITEINALEGKTQFETITNLFSTETQQKYESFENSYLWTLNSVRFPQLLFSNFESIVTVETEAQLIQELTFKPYATIVVANDIYLSKNWVPTAFKGTLIGQELAGRYPIIYNLNIDSTPPVGQTAIQDVGFFSTLESANIANLTFVVGGRNNVSYTGSYPNGIVAVSEIENSTAAVLVGNLSNSSIKNIHIRFADSSTKFTTNSQFTGVIAGKAKNAGITNVTIEHQTSNTTNITYTGTNNVIYVGGVAGQLELSKLINVTIKDTALQVTPSEQAFVGGAVGRLDSVYIKDLHTNVPINVVNVNPSLQDANSYIGGIAGFANEVELIDSKAVATMTSGTTRNIFMGGVLGYVTNSNIVSVNYENTVSNSINSSSQTIVSKIGGLAGYGRNTSIINSYAKTNINLNNKTGSTFVGGLLGHIENKTTNNTILTSYAITNINVAASSTVFAGGFIGSNGAETIDGIGGSVLNAIIQEAYSQGTLTVTGASASVYVGGLIGVNKVKAYYVFSAVKVFVNAGLTQNVGGLIGYNDADSINDAYVYGTLFSNQNMLKIGTKLAVNPVIGVGKLSTSLNRVYYNKDIISLADRNLINHARSHNQLVSMDVAPHNGLFIKTATSYPYLKNLPYALEAGDLLNPITISDAQSFDAIDGSNKHYVQTQNFTATSKLDNFYGIYNGNALQITYAPSVSENLESSALIDELKLNAYFVNANVINNVTLSSNVNNYYYVSTVAKENRGVIYKIYARLNVNNGEPVDVRSGRFAGITTNNSGLIEYSFANVTLNLNFNNTSTTAYIGGLAAYTANTNFISTINSSSAIGMITANKLSGTSTVHATGLVGDLSGGAIRNSFTTITISGSNVSVQGLYANATSGATTSNVAYDIHAITVRSADANQNIKQGLSSTKNMTSAAFKDALEINGLLSSSWTLSNNLNYGYPYPSFFNVNDYATNPLNTGNGTKEHPFKIHHAGRLDWVRTQLSSSFYFEQVRNIDLSSYYISYTPNNETPRTSFTPIGEQVIGDNTVYYGTSSFTTFMGIYDGKNYTINNLKQSYTGTITTVHSGLFAKLEGGAVGSYKFGYVYNVGLTNVNISVNAQANITSAYLGAIAGYSLNGKIINSYATGVVDSPETFTDANSNGVYDLGESYVDKDGNGEYSARPLLGGLVDLRDKTDNADKNLYLGGLVGVMENSELNYSYTKDLNIKSSFGYVGGIASAMIYSSSIKNSSSGSVINIYSIYSSNTTNKSYYTVGGVVAYSNDSNLYHVENVGWLRVNAGRLTSSFLASAGGVVGTQVGGSLTHAKNYVKVDIKEAASNNWFLVGGIAGYVEDVITIQTLENFNEVKVYHVDNRYSASYVGGIFGQAKGTTATRTMSYLKNHGTITLTKENNNTQGSIYVGGILGYTVLYNMNFASNDAVINAPVIVKQNLYAYVRVGGIAGESTNSISNSHNLGIINLTAESSISNNPDVEVYLGGIAGKTNTVTNSYNSGVMNVNNPNTKRTIHFKIGGITGEGRGLTSVYNTASINLNLTTNEERNISLGGIAGEFQGTLSKAYNTGNISVTYYKNTTTSLSGIVGSMDAGTSVITQVYNMGDLNHSQGFNYPTTGQIVGFKNGTTTITLQHFYNQEVIDAIPIYAGATESVYMGSYGYSFDSGGHDWDTAGHTGKNDSKINGHTLANMQKQATYTGWNFVYDWAIVENVSAPTLRIISTFNINDGNIAEPSIELSALQLPAVEIPTYTTGTPSGGGSSGEGGGGMGGTNPKVPGELAG